MDRDFWEARWNNNEIAFHERDGNQLFTKHVSSLNLGADARVFLPLCGKSRDISHLRDAGYRVVGAELSELAVQQLFDELGVKPTITQHAKAMLYSDATTDIFVGDIFDLSSSTLGRVDAIYDRAALVALPEPMRSRYTEKLIDISDAAPQLTITFEYDQQQLDGPPFSVSSELVHAYYGEQFDIQELERITVEGRLKGRVDAEECVWLLAPKAPKT